MCPQCRLPLKARDCPGVVAAPRRHRRIVPGRMRGPEICPRLCKHHHHHQQLKGIYVCFNGWELTEEEGHDGSLHDGLSTPVCGERWSIIRSLVWVSSVRAQPLTMEQGGDAAWQHTRRCWMWPASFLCDAVNSVGSAHPPVFYSLYFFHTHPHINQVTSYQKYLLCR